MVTRFKADNVSEDDWGEYVLYADYISVLSDNTNLMRAMDDYRLHNTKIIERHEDDMVNRLRGLYIIPVNDGCGPLNGKTEFERTFAVGALYHQAADRIAKMLLEIEDLKSKISSQ